MTEEDTEEREIRTSLTLLPIEDKDVAIEFIKGRTDVPAAAGRRRQARHRASHVAAGVGVSDPRRFLSSVRESDAEERDSLAGTVPVLKP